MKMRPSTEVAFNNITDCFSGADGGGAFIMTREMIANLDKMAKDGDLKAEQVIEIVIRMSRLIDTAQRPEAFKRGKKSE